LITKTDLCLLNLIPVHEKSASNVLDHYQKILSAEEALLSIEEKISGSFICIKQNVVTLQPLKFF